MTTNENAKTVYIETSVVSYLTARATGNLMAAAWQTATVEWWDTQSPRFALCTSALTIEEAGRGNEEAASRRLRALNAVSILPYTDAVEELVDSLIREKAMPENARNDAIHIAVATVHGIDYLLTWNFRHIANVESRSIIRALCERRGYRGREICTPSEVMGGSENA